MQSLLPVMKPPDPKSVAARVKGLIGGQDNGLIAITARRLGVNEVALRITIDDLEPHPTLEVIMAVVRVYGVDPTWLVTGEYDPTSHRLAMDDEANFTKSDLCKLLGRPRESGTDESAGDTGLRLEA